MRDLRQCGALKERKKLLSEESQAMKVNLMRQALDECFMAFSGHSLSLWGFRFGIFFWCFWHQCSQS
jgi:hypothetical protein